MSKSEAMDISQVEENGETKGENADGKSKEENKEIEEDEPELIENEVTLSWYDSDLNLTIEKDTLCTAKPVCEGRFARIWAGARATHGYTTDKVCFQVKILELLDVSDCIYIKREVLPHQIRIGWSSFDTTLQLGEDPTSYAIDSSGKAFENCKYRNYGRQFNKKNEVITAYLDFTGENVDISFALNNTDLGTAFSVPKEGIQGKALAPHILTKNIKFEVNFGQVAPWGTIKPDFQFVSDIPLQHRTRGPRAPPSREECEVILVCGLPAAGKTHWSTEYAKKNPEKRYTIISINALAEKMKINGVPRKLKTDVYEGPNVKCLEKLMHIGCHRRRNYILDQTSWKRKIRNFENFTQKCVVIQPTLEEYRKRVSKQLAEGERYVSDSDTYDVTSKYTLPDPSLFAEVVYTELGPGELEKVMEVITAEAKEKFAKILADAKTSTKKVAGSLPQKQKQNSPRGGGFNNNPSKRMKGSYGVNDGYTFSNFSTTYPLKRPMPGYQGGNWRPLVPTPPRTGYGPNMGNMGTGLLGPRVPPRGYMSPPGAYRSGPPNQPYGPAPQRRGGPPMPQSRMGYGGPMPRDFRGGPWGDYTNNGDYYMDDDPTDRADWGRWWNEEGRKMYGRWLASNY